MYIYIYKNTYIYIYIYIYILSFHIHLKNMIIFTEIFGLLLLFLRKMKYKPVFFLFYSDFLCIHLTFSFYFQRNFSMIDVHIFFFLLVFLLWVSLVFIHLFTVCLANFYSFMLFVNATLL